MLFACLGKFAKMSIMCFVLILLVGCGPQNTRYFPHLNRDKTISAGKNDVIVSVHMLSHQDCDNYFGIDVIRQGYRPLMLTIENRSSDTYVLRPSYFVLPRVSGKEISRLMHYDTYRRMAWLTIPALIYFWEAIPLLIVPYGFSCKHYNDKTTRNIRKKTWGRSEVLTIAPYETVQKFIFVVNAAFASTLEIKLYNETTQKLETYTINVTEA